ncbi:MAG: hypothetical protein IPL08_03895 [Saprospiraceae bacterium]|nr:hypothetical protein [Saprospiraceae bacterium]
MQKFNIFYWVILPLLIFSLYYLTGKLKLSHREYFGFAENKQSEINLDKDVIISKILVKTGEKVKKGQLLITVNNPDMSQEISQISLAMGGLKIKNDLSKSELEAEIFKLEKERDIRIGELQAKIKNIEQEDGFYKSLLTNNDVGASKDLNIKNPNEQQILTIQGEISDIRFSYDSNISHYRKMISQPKETAVSREIYDGKKKYLTSELQKFNITAPFDGVVGSINVREGENVKAFSSMISFYESTPPMVLAYIQEKFDLNIKVGDSVMISSVYNTNKKVGGRIAAKGNRIVEIPEKFRKIQDVKLYGIEVFIKIPADNAFYQKEVLRISEVQ